MHVAFGVSMALAAAAITTAPVAAPLEMTPVAVRVLVSCEATESVETTPVDPELYEWLESLPANYMWWTCAD